MRLFDPNFGFGSRLLFCYHQKMRKIALRHFLICAFLSSSPCISNAAENPTSSDISLQQSVFSRYTDAAQDVILKGLELVGISYRWGGAKIDVGLDCSGYVQVVFKDAVGLVLPRTAKEMSELGEQVDISSLKPGDLVFFNTMRRAFSHVGIYLGDSYFLHAPRKGAEVRVESMDKSYWLQRYNGARRLITPRVD